MKQDHTFLKFMKDIISSGTWALLSPGARALYPVLCHFSDDKFKAVWPGTNLLLQLTGFKTKKSLQSAKRELVEIGLIDFIPGTGRTPSRYYFRFSYPGSRVDLNILQGGGKVSPRGEEGAASGGVGISQEGGMGVSPNYIHININQNPEKQTTQLLSDVKNLLETFIQAKARPEQDEIKTRVSEYLLEKYGQLEIGEAIKIAISRGKNGDIKYLEGILRNRQESTGIKGDPSRSRGGPVPVSPPEILADCEYLYEFNGIRYYSTPLAQDQAKELETMAKAQGFPVKILCRKNGRQPTPIRIIHSG